VRVWKLKWGLGMSLGSRVGHGRERRCEFIGGANGGGGGLRGLPGRARGKKREGFYRLDDASRRFCPTFVAYKSTGMGAEAEVTCGAPAANGGWQFARQRVCTGRVAPA
jgi:hypothetical protein